MEVLLGCALTELPKGQADVPGRCQMHVWPSWEAAVWQALVLRLMHAALQGGLYLAAPHSKDGSEM